MTDKQIIYGIVSDCDNHYIENNKHICKYNFEECKPKNEQCALYVTNIEEQLKRAEQKLAKIKLILVINARELEENLSHDYGKQIIQIIEE